MDFKNTYWEVVKTKDDLAQLREEASSKTIKEMADFHGISYAKMATVLRVNDVRAKSPERPKKEKPVKLPKKDHDLTHWASCHNKGRIHHVYYNMLRRCHDPKNKGYKDYGARGITVCDEWRKDCCNFYKWARDNGYNENLQLDRIDNNKGYSPDNCRWVSARENNLNRRNTLMVTYKGERKPLADWAVEKGLNYYTLKDRICRYGWSVDKALETPVDED